MKTRKLLLVALLLAFASVGFGQNTIDHLGKIRMRYNNNGIPDTLTMSFSGDTVKYNANEGFHKFNGGVIADSLKLTGENSWVTELMSAGGGIDIQLYEAAYFNYNDDTLHTSSYFPFDSISSQTGDTCLQLINSTTFEVKKSGLLLFNYKVKFSMTQQSGWSNINFITNIGDKYFYEYRDSCAYYYLDGSGFLYFDLSQEYSPSTFGMFTYRGDAVFPSVQPQTFSYYFRQMYEYPYEPIRIYFIFIPFELK